MLVHFIENGVVINTVQQDTLENPFGYLAVASETAGIGWLWDGTKLTAPVVVAPIPSKVTRRQARQALVLAGKYDLVQPALDAIADPVQRKLMQIEWDDSLEFERNRPSLIAIGTAIGLSSSQIDDLFRTAATL